jgi:hypothetical protein
MHGENSAVEEQAARDFDRVFCAPIEGRHAIHMARQMLDTMTAS